MFCAKCGAQTPAGARYCPTCGMLQEIQETPYAGRAKRLVRPRLGRTIAGVCLGIAQYQNWDVTLVRIAAVIITILSVGTGILVYFLGWVAIPEADYNLPPGTVPPPPPPAV